MPPEVVIFTVEQRRLNLPSFCSLMRQLHKGKQLESVEPATVYRLFNPQVPVVICTKFGKEVAAMPANSCSSTSDSPSMITVALNLSANTNKVLRRSSIFSVNWLNFQPKNSRNIIHKLSQTSKGNHDPDKLHFHKIPYVLIRKTPVLSQACAYALCIVVKRLRTGDHDLFIARVVRALALRDFTDDGYWRFEHYKPILYLGSIRKDPLVTF